MIQKAYKIKKNGVIVTVRGVILFFEFLKASIADLISLLSSAVQNSEGGGDGGDSCVLTPSESFKKVFGTLRSYFSS